MKKYLLEHKIYIFKLLTLLIIGNIAAILVQFFRGDVLDAAITGASKNTIYSGFFMVTAIMIELIFYYFMFITGDKLASKCVESLKADVFETILNSNYKKFYSCDKGEYISKLTNEVSLINEKYFLNFNGFCEVSIKALMVVISIFILNWKLAIISLFLMTLPIYVPKLIQKKLESSTSNYIQSINKLMLKINDYLSGYEIIHNYSLSYKFIKKFNKFNKETQDNYYNMRKLSSGSRSLSAILSYMSFFIVVMFSASLVLSGEFTAGEFFAAIGLIDQLSWPIISISTNIQKFISVKPVATSILDFMKVEHIQNKKDLTNKISNIEYKKVSFSYDDTKLIKDFDANFEDNHKYLIKGESGCGKTTLINLLLSYEKATSGEIYVNGMSIDKIGDIYKRISIVRQEAFLFSDTLRNNIALYEEMDDSEILEALNKVNLKKFATKDGLDMLVENEGTNLSGGEKKRISLARALARKKDILILDEPLANLDDTNSSAIEDIILNITDMTVIVISHTFSESKLYKFDNVYNLSD